MKKRLARLIPPYILWSCVYFILYGLFFEWNTPSYYAEALLLGNAAAPFYYIVTLVIFTVFTPFLDKCAEKKYLVIVILALTPIFQFVGYISLINGNEDIWSWLRYTPVWIVFYFGGILLKKYPFNISKKVIFLLIPSLAVEMIETVIWKKVEYLSAYGYGQYRISGFIYAMVICSVVIAFSDYKYKTSVLQIIGDYSFVIFFAHYAFIVVLDKLLPNTMPMVFVWALELFISISGGIVIGALLKRTFRKKSIIFGI